MNFRSKKILLSFLLLFSFTILADGYICEDLSSVAVGDHCCIQCCPSHHLAPPAPAFSLVVEPLGQQSVTLMPIQARPLLLVASIFHPPKIFLS